MKSSAFSAEIFLDSMMTLVSSLERDIVLKFVAMDWILDNTNVMMETQLVMMDAAMIARSKDSGHVLVETKINLTSANTQDILCPKFRCTIQIISSQLHFRIR